MPYKPKPCRPLTEAQKELAGRPESLALARAIARRYARLYPQEAETVEAAALFGLVDAARLFDARRHLKFASYASHRIAGAVNDALRESLPLGYRRKDNLARRQSGEVLAVRSLSQVVYVGERGPVPLADCIEAPHDRPDEVAEYADFVRGITRGLEDDAREAVRLYYLRGLTLAKIGRKLRKSESRVSQIITAAYPLLRRVIVARLGETTHRAPAPVTQAVLNRRRRNRRAAQRAKNAQVAR